ncbi:MAG: hypothetical protein LC803_24190 [Acidobacteria bacterium]|nr:hypothetical protein [Acidobacteriota bacterium]
MDFIGFDLRKVAGQICIITADGELLEHRIKTERFKGEELKSKIREAAGWSHRSAH